jgi:hypothetical protein
MAEELIQLNVHVPPEFIEKKVKALCARYGWSRRGLVMTAIDALAQVMKAHDVYANQHDDEIGELYLRLAAEMPAGFVEVPKDGIRVGRAGDLPAVLVDNWLVFPDRETGALLAENQGADGPRVARIVDGEIKPLKMPTAAEVALN